MMGPSAVLSVALGAQFAFATAFQARTSYSVKETHSVPSKWSQIGRANRSHMLQLQIGLKQGNFDELERHLYEGTYLSVALEEQF
jgi:tripeptidyl-peptidase I